MNAHSIVKKFPVALIVALVAMMALGPTVFAQGPSIQLTKTTTTPEVLQGGTAKFTIVVRNTGGVALKNVQVTDACDVGPTLQPGGDANNNNILETTETWTYTCEVNNVLASFSNFARVTAVSNDAAQNPVSSQDDAPVTVLNPGIHLTKAPVYPAGRTYFVQGETVVFNIGIRNTGDFDIKQADITFSDLLCNPVVNPKTQAPASTTPAANTADDATEIEAGRDGAGNPDRLAGEVWNYTCTVPNASSNVVNQASITVKDVFAQTYSHSASATARVVTQGLAITKESNKPAIATTEVMTWTVKIYNTGATNLGTPTVTDALIVGQCANVTTAPWTQVIQGGDNDNQLEPNEVWTYVCRVPAGTYPVGQTDNTASVTAGGLTAVTTASVVVVDPAFSFTVIPPIQYVMKGQNATLTYKVTNTGSGAITDVQVANPQCAPLSGPTGDTNNNGRIDPDNPATGAIDPETWTYICTIPNLQQNLDTQATFQGKVAGNTIPSTTPPARVNAKILVINPGLNIKKTADPVIYGGTATFKIEVTNNGNVEYYKNDNVVAVPYPMPVDPQCDAGTLARTSVNPNDGDNAIDPGEVWVYTCTKANVTKEFDNTATISVKDPAGNVVSASSTVTVKVLTPGLSLQKLPAYQVIEVPTVGTKNIEWTLRLHNTGPTKLVPATRPVGVPVGGAGLSDFQCDTLVKQPDGPGNNDNTLDPGEVWVYKCTLQVFPWSIANPLIVNFADAYFTDSSGINGLYTSASARAQLVSTDINLSKTANPSIILPGQPVLFTFEVGNPGFDDLTSVDLVDTMCPGGKPTYVSGDANSDNKLNVTEKWVYQCTVSGQQNDYTNVATVTANGPSGTVQRSTATATVQVINAKMDVNKTANPSTVNQGGTVNFTIEVKNTGTEQLKDVVASDDKCTLSAPTGDTNGNSRLDTNETWTYTCSVANVQNSFRNAVSVTAKENSSGLTVTGSDFVDVTVTRPGINLIKTANQASVDEGDTALFTIIVNNAGSINLTSVQPVDAFCSLMPLSLGNGNTTLETGESWVYLCSVPNVVGTNGVFVNNASVTAIANNISVSDSDSATVIVNSTPPPGNPGIDVEKTPDSQVVAKGSNVSFDISVRNSGDVALTNVVVNDPLCTLNVVSKGNGDATLDVGEVWTYTCTISNVRAALTNTASASGQSAAGQTVSDSDSAMVSIAGNRILLEKSPKTQTILKGSDATFLVTLNNPTAEDLTSVVLSDPQCTTLVRESDAPGNNDNVLNTGETWQWTCTIANVQKSFTNKAKATAKRPNGRAIKATARAKVKVVTSSRLRVSTTPDNATILAGSNVPVTIKATNVSRGRLINVTVSHDACSDEPVLVSNGDGDDKLSSGETWTFTCTIDNVQGEVNGAAVVTAVDEESGAIETDDALIDIEILNADDDEVIEDPIGTDLNIKTWLPFISH